MWEHNGCGLAVLHIHVRDICLYARNGSGSNGLPAILPGLGWMRPEPPCRIYRVRNDHVRRDLECRPGRTKARGILCVQQRCREGNGHAEIYV
jgi:hypothetical protein